MELGVVASAHSGAGRRVAPVGCGVALVGAASYIGTHDPGVAGSYPGCAFHQLTGLWCPGCGLTRGTYQLLHGHVGAAVSYNVFAPLVVAAVVVVWVGWLRASWGAKPIQVSHRVGRLLAVMAPVLLIVYGVLRNLPVASLRTLAP